MLGIRERRDRQAVCCEGGRPVGCYPGQAGQDLSVVAGEQDRDLVLDRGHVDLQVAVPVQVSA